MPETARFCPGCGAPRTHVRAELERRAAESGVSYEQLLAQARAEDQRERQIPGTPWAEPAPPGAAVPPPPEKRSRLWLILGIVGGSLLLLCICCAAAVAIAWDRYDVEVGEGEAGRAAREQLERGARGDFEGRWEMLHPSHRAEVPLSDFVDCGERPDVDGIEVLAEFTAETDVALLGDIDVRYVIYGLDSGATGSSTFARMTEQDDLWYWLMDTDDLNAYFEGRCP
jgi:hypothetical protein